MVFVYAAYRKEESMTSPKPPAGGDQTVLTARLQILLLLHLFRQMFLWGTSGCLLATLALAVSPHLSGDA